MELCNKLSKLKLNNEDSNNMPRTINNINNINNLNWTFDGNRIYLLLLFNLKEWKIIGFFNSLNELYISSGNIMLSLPSSYEISIAFTFTHKIIKFSLPNSNKSSNFNNNPNFNNELYSYNILIHCRKLSKIEETMEFLYKSELLSFIEQVELFYENDKVTSNYNDVTSNYNSIQRKASFEKLIKMNYDENSLYLFQIKNNHVIIDRNKITNDKIYDMCLKQKIEPNKIQTYNF